VVRAAQAERQQQHLKQERFPETFFESLFETLAFHVRFGATERAIK
jgi:hypothetical protein